MANNKWKDNETIRARLASRGVTLTSDEINTLRRAELTLQRWAELECGDGNDYASWSIERDEETGKPYLCTYPHSGESYRRPTPDREAGALRRVAAICQANGLHFYHQGDPRGCMLYVDREPLDAQNYTNGAAICG